MKKILMFLLLVSLSVSLVFATQLTFRRNSPEVIEFYALRHLSSTATPDPVFPISGSQLLGLLKTLDVSRLDSDALSIYNALTDKLENPRHDYKNKKAWIDLDAPFNTAIRARSSDTVLGEGFDDYVIFDAKDSITGHGFDAKIGIGENFAGRLNYTFNYPDKKEFRSDNFMFISTFFAFDQSDEEHKPNQAYASLGNDIINFIMGRDRTSAGNGKTGNLGFGDNLCYQDFAKFSAVYSPLSYDLTVYVFDTEDYEHHSIEPFYHNSAFEAVVSHRFSVTLLNKITASAYESVMTYGDNFSAIKYINPFLVLHNTYAFKDSNNNNFCGVEFNFSVKNFEISVNAMLDQFQFDFEVRNKNGAENIAPNAWAAQINATGVWTVKKGLLEAYAEAVYTSPVCYLKEEHGKNANEKYWWYQQDLLVGNCYQDYGTTGFLGYKYGPDTIAAGLGVSYTKPKWHTSADFLFLARGSYGRRNDMILYGRDLYDTNIRENSEKYLNAFSPLVFGDDVVEYIGQAVLKGSYSFDNYFTLNAGIGFIYAQNFRNTEGAVFQDVQASVSTTINIVPVIEKGIAHILKAKSK